MPKSQKLSNRLKDWYFWVFVLLFLLQGVTVVVFWTLIALTGPMDGSIPKGESVITAIKVMPIAFGITVFTLGFYKFIKQRNLIFWFSILPTILVNGYLAFQLARSELFWFGLLMISPFAFVISAIIILPMLIWSLLQDLLKKTM